MKRRSWVIWLGRSRRHCWRLKSYFMIKYESSTRTETQKDKTTVLTKTLYDNDTSQISYQKLASRTFNKFELKSSSKRFVTFWEIMSSCDDFRGKNMLEDFHHIPYLNTEVVSLRCPSWLWWGRGRPGGRVPLLVPPSGWPWETRWMIPRSKEADRC